MRLSLYNEVSRVIPRHVQLSTSVGELTRFRLRKVHVTLTGVIIHMMMRPLQEEDTGRDPPSTPPDGDRNGDEKIPI